MVRGEDTKVTYRAPSSNLVAGARNKTRVLSRPTGHFTAIWLC